MAQYLAVAAGRVQQPREHFEGRRFSGSVGSEEPDHLTLAHLEIDLFNRFDLTGFAAQQAFEGGHDPRTTNGNGVDFGEIANLNRGFVSHFILLYMGGISYLCAAVGASESKTIQPPRQMPRYARYAFLVFVLALGGYARFVGLSRGHTKPPVGGAEHTLKADRSTTSTRTKPP